MIAFASAQFQMFEHLFNQGGQQQQRHQKPQNVASDSDWYGKTYDGGMLSLFLRFSDDRSLLLSLFSSCSSDGCEEESNANAIP